MKNILSALIKKDDEGKRLDEFLSRKFTDKSRSSFQKLIEPLEKHPLPDPTDFYKEGDNVNGFTVLYTPGHTQGSICLWSKEAGILFSGDTLFYGSRGRTDLLGGNEMQICQSLKRLFTELPGSTQVYPGHGSNTTIEFEKKYQGAYV